MFRYEAGFIGLRRVGAEIVRVGGGWDRTDRDAERWLDFQRLDGFVGSSYAAEVQIVQLDVGFGVAPIAAVVFIVVVRDGFRCSVEQGRRGDVPQFGAIQQVFVAQAKALVDGFQLVDGLLQVGGLLLLG